MPSVNGEEYVTKAEFRGQIEEDISFPEKATIEVIEKSISGWWMVRCVLICLWSQGAHFPCGLVLNYIVHGIIKLVLSLEYNKIEVCVCVFYLQVQRKNWYGSSLHACTH